MAVSTFRHRKFTTVASGDLSHASRGFKTTSVNENNNPCIMKLDFDHQQSKVTVDVEEWDQNSIRMVDHRRWIFTPSLIESYYWGMNPDGTLKEEPYVTIYPSEFTIAYSSGGNIESLNESLAKMDSRPALENYAYQYYPEPQSKSIVQIEFDAKNAIVINVYPVRDSDAVEVASKGERKETSEAWFKALLGKGRAFA